jgi:pimeloyl-ACP methyl ester carboxylesterase
MTKKQTLVEQLRGASKLAVEATKAVTDLVEEVHHTIGGGPDLLGRPLQEVTKLLSAPTYGAIRGVTKVVGAGLDLALQSLEPMITRAGAEQGVLLAALNGVLGDYLEETHNPLAIPMELRRGGVALKLDRAALTAQFPAGDRLLVLVHGSSMDDTQWLRNGHEHGAALAAELGVVPISLRYNTGLHVSENGRRFSVLLDQLVEVWPRPVTSLTLLAHSMGGLVSRSACLEAEANGRAWRSRLTHLITLGTPHHGSPLERGGNWFEELLGVTRYSAPFAKLAKVRSAGVTDLRYGNVLDAHWEGRDRFTKEDDPRGPMALPAGVKCFAVAGTTSAGAALGDGLVPVPSALGQHEDPARTLAFTETIVVPDTTHLELLDSPVVYAQLVRWLRD